MNAVLRRVSEKGKAIIADQEAVRLTTPVWLWESWLAAYGEPVTRGTAEIHLAEPPLDLSIKDLSRAEDWASCLGGHMLPTAQSGVKTPDAFRTWRVSRTGLGGFRTRRQRFRLGFFFTRWPTVRVNRNRSCAAPGGKTTQLAIAGCDVTAVDIEGKRLERVRQNLSRLQLNANVVEGDAIAWRPPALVDAVLLDAPCSATGTIRRHPDLPFLKRASDIALLADMQKKLLAAAVEMVKPSGLIFYSVCSLQPEERRQAIESFLAADARVTLEKIPPAAVGGEIQFISPRGELRTLPCQWAEHGGLDGFYGALLRKAAIVYVCAPYELRQSLARQPAPRAAKCCKCPVYSDQERSAKKTGLWFF